MGSDGQPGLGLSPASASLQLCHLGPDRGLVRSSCPVGPRQGLEGLEDSIWHKLCDRQLPSAPDAAVTSPVGRNPRTVFPIFQSWGPAVGRGSRCPQPCLLLRTKEAECDPQPVGLSPSVLLPIASNLASLKNTYLSPNSSEVRGSKWLSLG